MANLSCVKGISFAPSARAQTRSGASSSLSLVKFSQRPLLSTTHIRPPPSALLRQVKIRPDRPPADSEYIQSSHAERSEVPTCRVPLSSPRRRGSTSSLDVRCSMLNVVKSRLAGVRRSFLLYLHFLSVSFLLAPHLFKTAREAFLNFAFCTLTFDFLPSSNR